jgi:hypothetical protein
MAVDQVVVLLVGASLEVAVELPRDPVGERQSGSG